MRLQSFRHYLVLITLLPIMLSGCADFLAQHSLPTISKGGTLKKCRLQDSVVTPLVDDNNYLTAAHVCLTVTAENSSVAEETAKEQTLSKISELIKNFQADAANSAPATASSDGTDDEQPVYAPYEKFVLEQFAKPIRAATLIAGGNDFTYYSKLKIIITNMGNNKYNKLIAGLKSEDFPAKDRAELVGLLDILNAAKPDFEEYQVLKLEKIKLIKAELANRGCDQNVLIYYRDESYLNSALNIKDLIQRELQCGKSVVEVEQKSLPVTDNIIYYRSHAPSQQIVIPRYIDHLLQYLKESFSATNRNSFAIDPDIDLLLVLHDAEKGFLNGYFNTEVALRTPIWPKSARTRTGTNRFWLSYLDKNGQNRWAPYKTKKREWDSDDLSSRYTGPPFRYVRIRHDNDIKTDNADYSAYTLVDFLNSHGRLEQGLVLSEALKRENRGKQKIMLRIGEKMLDYLYIPESRRIEIVW